MASSPKKQMLSQRKLFGAASYASSCIQLYASSCNISIQFLQEKLLKNFDATCVYAMPAVLPKGRQMLRAIVMVQITSSAKKHSRIQGR